MEEAENKRKEGKKQTAWREKKVKRKGKSEKSGEEKVMKRFVCGGADDKDILHRYLSERKIQSLFTLYLGNYERYNVSLFKKIY